MLLWTRKKKPFGEGLRAVELLPVTKDARRRCGILIIMR